MKRQLIVKSSSWCLATQKYKADASALWNQKVYADQVGLVDGGAGERENGWRVCRERLSKPSPSRSLFATGSERHTRFELASLGSASLSCL